MQSGQDGNIYIKVPARGNQADGEIWDDGPAGQVRQISIFHDDIIRSIQTTYLQQGRHLITPKHGGDAETFEMITTEPLTWVSGHYGSYSLDDELFVDEDECPWNFTTGIRSLKFGNDSITYGPFGHERGRHFILKSSSGIYGFHGRSTNYSLNAIGIYVKTLATDVTDNAPPSDSLVRGPSIEVEEPQKLTDQ